MSAKLGFDLSLETIGVLPPAQILAQLTDWLVTESPTCLRHPHGFFVIPLLISDETDWRFHVWPAATRVRVGMPGMIHTHSRDVDSRILAGELRNDQYLVEDHDLGSPIYVAEYGGSRYSQATTNALVKTGRRVVATEVSSTTLQVGDTYHVSRDAYHQAVVEKGRLAATIVRTSNGHHGSAMVIGLDNYPETIAFKREPIRASEVVEALRRAPSPLLPSD